jgi:DNA polymerase I-like protein with 3'-5' exonuclease and polymerase domains
LDNSLEGSNGFGSSWCCNLPIQGACANVMLRAVAGVHRKLHGDGYNAVMVAMIHDYLILEADAQAAEAASELLAEKMTTAFSVTFPDASLGGLIDVKTGSSWSSLK